MTASDILRQQAAHELRDLTYTVHGDRIVVVQGHKRMTYFPQLVEYFDQETGMWVPDMPLEPVEDE